MPEKPKCPLIGQNGNIFNLMGIASKTLKRNGMSNDAWDAGHTGEDI